MINTEEIKTAIVEREEEIKQKFEREKIIEREGMEYVKRLISTDAALIITGVRRCGKSILAVMLGKGEKYGYVNFEDERLAIEANELNKVLEAIYSLKGDIDFLIFDEIQNINGWERFIARLIQNKKVVITGSNARLLSKELATYLTGRHVDFTLFPFSFKEFLEFKEFRPNIHLTRDIAKLKNYLKEYLKKGGFPLAYKIGNIFLIENYKDVIERDILQRYKIKYVKVLKDLTKYLISNISNEISYNQLKNIFKIKSVHTVKNYITYLQNSYLIFVLERFSFKLKEQMLAPKKIYCIDNGIADSVGFKFSENRGNFYENVVALQLFRKTCFDKKMEIYYWKDHQQNEVDFVIKRKEVEQLIQVTLANSENEIKPRELKALLKASKELKCKNLLVITEDYEATKEQSWFGIKRKIKFMPLWKWLLK
ncbi:MAG: ATP-binding protein [Candidatus Pacearchaeota archaeon]